VITEAKMDNMVANQRAVDAMNDGCQFDERSNPSTPAANKLHIYAKDKSGVSTLFAINDAGTIYELSEVTPAFTFTITGTLVTGTSLAPALIVPKAFTITKAYAFVKTGPTGGNAIIIDINLGGTSIWSATPANRLQIASGATSGTRTSFDTTALAESNTLTPDVDQVGNTVAGADLTVMLKVK
jgi:hypothetical protein